MTQALLQQRQIDQVINAFFAFFEWCHGVTFGPHERAHLRGMLIARWDDSAAPAKKLAGYIANLWNIVLAQPPQQLDRLRLQARGNIQSLLRHANGRGPVLATLHFMLETLQPGCSGVPLPVQPSAQQPSSAPPPQATATAPQAGQPYPVQPYQPYPPQACPQQYPTAYPQQYPTAPANAYAPPQPASPAGPVGVLDPDQLYTEKQQLRAREQNWAMRVAVDDAMNRMTQRILDSMSR